MKYFHSIRRSSYSTKSTNWFTGSLIGSQQQQISAVEESLVLRTRSRKHWRVFTRRKRTETRRSCSSHRTLLLFYWQWGEQMLRLPSDDCSWRTENDYCRLCLHNQWMYRVEALCGATKEAVWHKTLFVLLPACLQDPGGDGGVPSKVCLSICETICLFVCVCVCVRRFTLKETAGGGGCGAANPLTILACCGGRTHTHTHTHRVRRRLRASAALQGCFIFRD